MAEPSDELTQLAFVTLDHGIDSVKTGGPLTPFAVVENEGGRQLHRFLADTLEEGQEQARQDVRAQSGAIRAAIAWDGYLTVEGEQTDAVLVEAYQRGDEGSFVFAQRYRPGGRLKRFATIGNAALAGTGEPLF